MKRTLLRPSLWSRFLQFWMEPAPLKLTDKTLEELDHREHVTRIHDVLLDPYSHEYMLEVQSHIRTGQVPATLVDIRPALSHLRRKAS